MKKVTDKMKDGNKSTVCKPWYFTFGFVKRLKGFCGISLKINKSFYPLKLLLF